ncbi:MAG: YggU family protein [Nitrospirae bacterium]|nr:YggU family protein [Nitrospirota bacterium]
MDIPFSKTRDGIIIEVKVAPRSSKVGIAGVMDNMLKVKLTAPPVDGAANDQLIELLAETYGVSKSNVTILRGETSKRKTVKITGVKM